MEGFGAGLRFFALGRGGWRVVGLGGGFRGWVDLGEGEWRWVEAWWRWVEVGERLSTTPAS